MRHRNQSFHRTITTFRPILVFQIASITCITLTRVAVINFWIRNVEALEGGRLRTTTFIALIDNNDLIEVYTISDVKNFVAGCETSIAILIDIWVFPRYDNIVINNTVSWWACATWYNRQSHKCLTLFTNAGFTLILRDQLAFGVTLLYQASFFRYQAWCRVAVKCFIRVAHAFFTLSNMQDFS